MCSPATDTFNHTFSTFLHLFFWILQKKKWDNVLLLTNIHLLFSTPTQSEGYMGLAPLYTAEQTCPWETGEYTVRANKQTKRLDRGNKSSVLPLFGNVNIKYVG